MELSRLSLLKFPHALMYDLNLADVGYDGSNMSMMSYDWRLGYDMMEKRDGFFTKLKKNIEAHYITSGEKVIMVSHRYAEAF